MMMEMDYWWLIITFHWGSYIFHRLKIDLAQLEIPENFRSVFSVSPMEGILQGNETKTVEWTFSPTKAKQFKMNVR